MSEKPRVFLDASCWITAVGFPTGGSAMILRLARGGYLRIIATTRVLQEAERNIKAKMGQEALLRYFKELGSTEIELAGPPTAEEEARWQDLVAKKDCHVLAGAHKAQVDMLVTLDKHHTLTEIVKRGFPIPLQNTNEFLKDLADRLTTAN